MHPEELQPRHLIGKKTLITGEVNAGKTSLTLLLANRLVAATQGERIAIIDLAPDMSGTGRTGVGGGLAFMKPGALRLAASLAPPRLTATSDTQALLVAQANLGPMVELFERFEASGRDVLVVNDLSMYFQAATVASLLRRIAIGRQDDLTLLANGYVGTSLGSGPLTDMEQSRMAEFAARCDRVIRL